jgi:hypothetical protein
VARPFQSAIDVYAALRLSGATVTAAILDIRFCRDQPIKQALEVLPSQLGEG